MSTNNSVRLHGNLGQDPELRVTQSGTAVTTLRLATNERFKNQAGEWETRTEWHNVVVWGKRAEGLTDFLRKGSELLIEGRLQTRSWEDQRGQKRYTTEVVAEDVVLCGKRERAPAPTDEDAPPEVKATRKAEEVEPPPF